MSALTPAHASDIITHLMPTLDACRRSILAEGRFSKTYLKDTPSGRETVSDLDLIVQNQLLAAIRTIEPGASVLSEEGEHDPSALDDDLCFVVDPIDGTDLMIAGDTGFSISVAILSAHRVVAGLLDFPARDQRFTGVLGQGTDLNGHRIHIASDATLVSSRIAVSSTQHAAPSLQPLWERFDVASLVPTPGFTAKLASILLGDCNAALYLPVEPRATFIWDYAAAALLLAEAGGRLTDMDGRNFLDDLPVQHQDGWLAAANQLHPLLLAAVTAALE